ncbi:DUF5642 family protein [Mycolicibacterium thermoresistibile]|jgi:hypothetical protein|uniref:DUF5642 domain-containing protein n=2 Tax=Mycolicibacterium thermoresistibile TaxID=1797 RepID=G7CCH4_MYCT3|nr:DUF5642 family protein [Mycolicibacterium thermoresistibile]EHI14437.1 hypothetical protein KEK_03346 [Mycolicibacterium thermoresistibile ATCC 19527]MCV7189600.1 DUF5642 family protein [Mycolicibacterium thermoresistibile]GAT14591.1 putative uncharacterized protein [Mycolicibacterium thermoresistibile]SNW19819.1 Conserved exported protein of uncharacterised function [Mycolicibacterium thermoresistibile]
MLKLKSALVVALVLTGLTACSTDDAEQDAPQADITRIHTLGEGFGPEFKVTEVPKAGIDPRLFESQPIPPGLTFDPPECDQFGSNRLLEPGLQGNMAAITAEGEGNRFIAIALETSEPISLNKPADNCKRVTFDGPNAGGVVENVESPQIDGAETVGTHRTLETRFAGQQPNRGEVFSYVASFDNYAVIVTANPLVLPDQPVEPVDTERARNLLVDAVDAVRG